MSAIGNFLWFIFGGFFMGLGWWFAGLLAFISIVGIPWGRACIVMGNLAFLPFGKEAINREDLSTTKDIGTGLWGTVGNIVWFLCLGLWLALGHVIVALLSFVTIIGIPFGIQHLKLAGIALAPIGKTVVSKEVAAAAKKANAEATVARIRSDGVVGEKVAAPVGAPLLGEKDISVTKKASIAGVIALIALLGFYSVKHSTKNTPPKGEIEVIAPSTRLPVSVLAAPPMPEAAHTTLSSQRTVVETAPPVSGVSPHRLAKANRSEAMVPTNRSKLTHDDNDVNFTTLDKANAEIDRAMDRQH